MYDQEKQYPGTLTCKKCGHVKVCIMENVSDAHYTWTGKDLDFTSTSYGRCYFCDHREFADGKLRTRLAFVPKVVVTEEDLRAMAIADASGYDTIEEMKGYK